MKDEKPLIERMEEKASKTDTPHPGRPLSGPIPGDTHEGSRPKRQGGTMVADNEEHQDEHEELMERLEAPRGETKTGVPIEGVHTGTPAGGTTTANPGADHWGKNRDDGRKVGTPND